MSCFYCGELCLSTQFDYDQPQYSIRSIESAKTSNIFHYLRQIILSRNMHLARIMDTLASPALALLNCRLATFGAVFHHHGSACDLVRKRLAEAAGFERAKTPASIQMIAQAQHPVNDHFFYRVTTGIKLNMPYICRSRNNFNLQKKRHFPNFRGSLPGLNIIYHPVMDPFVGQTNQRRRHNIQD